MYYIIFLQSSSTAKTNGHENGTSSKSNHRDRNGENGVDENGDEKRHHRKHKKKSRHLERMVSYTSNLWNVRMNLLYANDQQASLIEIQIRLSSIFRKYSKRKMEMKTSIATKKFMFVPKTPQELLDNLKKLPRRRSQRSREIKG